MASTPITEETIVTHKDVIAYLERARLDSIKQMKDINKRLE